MGETRPRKPCLAKGFAAADRAMHGVERQRDKPREGECIKITLIKS
jgi:hypothetical protein